MDLDQLLQSGASVEKGVSPLQRKKQLRAQVKQEKEPIIRFAKEHSLEECTLQFHLSESSIAKLCAPHIKKGELSPEVLLGTQQQLSDIEQYILGMNTSSIKKLVLHAPYSEGQLRIVKAYLERKEY